MGSSTRIRGDQHTATEFEIRQIDGGARVWGVTVMAPPRDQATLEQGNFEGPRAGRLGLEHGTSYAIRARHRDSSGDPVSEWSAWSAPTVTQTIPQDEAVPRPMRVRDIQPNGLRWETPDGATVALGTGNSLLITGSTSQLHEITGDLGDYHRARLCARRALRERVSEVQLGGGGAGSPGVDPLLRGRDGRAADGVAAMDAAGSGPRADWRADSWGCLLLRAG